MKKYVEVAKVLFKAQIVYRFDVMLTATGTLARVLFAWILWGTVFLTRERVGGFTLQGMLSYYVVSAFLASIDLSDGVSGEVSARIREGTFSKYMVIPSNPALHFMAQTFGAAAYYALFALAAAVACPYLFGVDMRPAQEILACACALCMIPLGLCFMICYHFCVGTLAFKFQEIGFFWHVQAHILAFATGAIIPLSLLPEAVARALNFLPFPYVTYAPAMLLTGQMGAREGFIGLAVLCAWTAFMYAAGQIAYGRLRVKFDGVGI